MPRRFEHGVEIPSEVAYVRRVSPCRDTDGFVDSDIAAMQGRVVVEADELEGGRGEDQCSEWMDGLSPDYPLWRRMDLHRSVDPIRIERRG
jgi:hypothetical protein